MDRNRICDFVSRLKNMAGRMLTTTGNYSIGIATTRKRRRTANGMHDKHRITESRVKANLHARFCNRVGVATPRLRRQGRRDAHRINHISISRFDQDKQLPEIKKDRPDLARIHSQVVQNVLKRVAFAFDNFFRRVKASVSPGYPRFRSSSRYDSFTYPQTGFELNQKTKKLRLSKIGSVKVHLSRPIEGVIKTCTIKREADGWYVIFAVEEAIKETMPAPKESVGVDVGIESFATCQTTNKSRLKTLNIFVTPNVR